MVFPKTLSSKGVHIVQKSTYRLPWIKPLIAFAATLGLALAITPGSATASPGVPKASGPASGASRIKFGSQVKLVQPGEQRAAAATGYPFACQTSGAAPQVVYIYGVLAVVLENDIMYRGNGCAIGLSYLSQQASDGDLVLYDEQGHARWKMSQKDSRAIGASYAYFQGFDGNLVSYASDGTPRAATDTCCIVDDTHVAFLAIQADGNLVIYRQDVNTGNLELKWQTKTYHQPGH
jgi:hypothetical protein